MERELAQHAKIWMTDFMVSQENHCKELAFRLTERNGIA
jgi:hypothetical protein